MRKLILIIAMVLFVGVAYAEPVSTVGEQALAVTSTAKSLTVPTSGPLVDKAIITNYSGDTVLWSVKDAPTALQGHPLVANGNLILDSARDITNFKCILQTGGSGASLYITYYGR